jgi:hypothetical protein
MSDSGGELQFFEGEIILEKDRRTKRREELCS